MLGTYKFGSIEISVYQNSFLIDTNVLIGLFKRNDQHSVQAAEFIETYSEGVFYVPVPVIVETWGNLVGRYQDFESGFRFVDWLQSPNVIIIPEICNELEKANMLMRKMNVDIVDALILDLADKISKQCNLKSPIIIATFDTKDFYKLMRLREYKFSLLDLKTFQLEEFN